MNDDLKSIIQKHNAKKLNSLSEATRRYLERYVWFEDKTNILVLSPRDSATGMRTWIAQGARRSHETGKSCRKVATPCPWDFTEASRVLISPSSFEPADIFKRMEEVEDGT